MYIYIYINVDNIIYIYIYIYMYAGVNPCISMHGGRRAKQRGAGHSNEEVAEEVQVEAAKAQKARTSAQWPRSR